MLNILKKLSDTILQHRIIILTIAILILTSLIQTQKNKDFAYAQEGDEKYYVTISPSAKTVNINEEFDAELTINKSPPKNISTVEIKIEYDPDILNLEITSPPKCTETKISDCVMDFSDNIYLFSVDQNKVDLGTLKLKGIKAGNSDIKITTIRIILTSDRALSLGDSQTAKFTVTAPTVTIQGHFVDQNGNFVIPNGKTVTIIGGTLSEPVTVTNNPGGKDATFWRKSSLSPSATNYVALASVLDGYNISYATCINRTNCTRDYTTNSNFAAVNLPTGGNYADIYFKYTPIPTPTLTPTKAPTLTPTRIPTSAPKPTNTPTPTPTNAPTPTPVCTLTSGCQQGETCMYGSEGLGCYIIRTPTPTPQTATPTPTPTSTPTPIPADSSSSTSTLTSCPFKSQGDANCDRIINISDFNIWRDEALIKTSSTTRADFNNDSVVDSTDLSIWIQSMRDKLRYIPAED